jgi:hypothetical protein
MLQMEAFPRPTAGKHQVRAFLPAWTPTPDLARAKNKIASEPISCGVPRLGKWELIQSLTAFEKETQEGEHKAFL